MNEGRSRANPTLFVGKQVCLALSSLQILIEQLIFLECVRSWATVGNRRAQILALMEQNPCPHRAYILEEKDS